jgi:hypothetical protein
MMGNIHYVSAWEKISRKLSDTEIIKEIIDSTPDGGECLIPEGYYEIDGIAIHKPITVRGDGLVTLRTRLNYNNSSSIEQNFVFAIWTDDVAIEGFRFDSTYAGGSVGIAHYLGDNISIRDNYFSISGNSMAIISKANSSHCVIDGNRFLEKQGSRTTPMIQLGKNITGARLSNNILEGDSPELLAPDFVDKFLALDTEHAQLINNEFEYTGTLSHEDLGGYEDEDLPEIQEAFKVDRLIELNPWPTIIDTSTASNARTSEPSKSNPDTGDYKSHLTLSIVVILVIAISALSRMTGRILGKIK